MTAGGMAGGKTPEKVRQPIFWQRFTAIGLVLATALAGCADGGPTDPADELAPVEQTLNQLASEANSAGDADAADGFSGGALALRHGVRPTPILVKIRGEEVRYLAFVAGYVRHLRNGERILHRTLIAWTGDPRTTAVLQVSLMTDHGLFGYPAQLSTALDPRGRARGTWADLVNGQRWVAIQGTAAIELAGTGDPCVRPTAGGASCVSARFDLRVDGGFQRLRSATDRTLAPDIVLPILTAATGVNGVVVSPAGDGGD